MPVSESHQTWVRKKKGVKEEDAKGVEEERAIEADTFPLKAGGNARKFKNLPFDVANGSRGAIRPEDEEMGSRSERDLGPRTSGGIASEVESVDRVIGRAMDELDLLAASMPTRVAEDSHSFSLAGALAAADGESVPSTSGAPAPAKPKGQPSRS